MCIELPSPFNSLQPQPGWVKNIYTIVLGYLTRQPTSQRLWIGDIKADAVTGG